MDTSDSHDIIDIRDSFTKSTHMGGRPLNLSECADISINTKKIQNNKKKKKLFLK